MPASRSRPRYLAMLTGLRALLAWDVFLFHYAEAPPGARLARDFIAGGGEVGVSLFFVLSGFLIAWQYGSRELRGPGAAATYFFRRWTRIYPLFLLVSCASLLVLRLQHSPGLTWLNLFLHFTLLKGFFRERIFLFVGPAWSLSVEECFYLVAPLLFLLRKRTGLLVPCLAIALAGWGITWWSARAGHTDFMPAYNFTFYWTFFGRIFQFACGSYLALRVQRQPAITRRFPLCTLAGSAAVIGAQFLFPQLHEVSAWGSPDLLAIAFNDLVLPGAAIVLFYGLITERTLVARLLETPLLTLLGKSSFAFYLLHLSPVIKAPFSRYHWPPWGVFILVQALSVLLYLLWEHPLHRLLNRWWDRRKGGALQDAVAS